MLLTELVRGSNPRVFISSCAPGHSHKGVAAGPVGVQVEGGDRLHTAVPGPEDSWGTVLGHFGRGRNPAAVVGSPADPGTAVEEGSPAAGEGLADMLPAVGHTEHYLAVGVCRGALASAP